MRVEIWSDVVCPWCYIGKRRFDTALANIGLRRGVDIDVVYRAYQLDPHAPPGGAQPVTEVYARKFGGPERAAQIISHVTSTAAEAGIEFRMDRALRANTLIAHRALWWAEAHQPVLQAPLKERLMQAYFTDGAHVGDPEVVADCAADIGIDRDEMRAFLATADGVAEVRAQIERAADLGIAAVPTFVVNDTMAIPGAQDVDVFERVFTKVWERERT